MASLVVCDESLSSGGRDFVERAGYQQLVTIHINRGPL